MCSKFCSNLRPLDFWPRVPAQVLSSAQTIEEAMRLLFAPTSTCLRQSRNICSTPSASPRVQSLFVCSPASAQLGLTGKSSHYLPSMHQKMRLESIASSSAQCEPLTAQTAQQKLLQRQPHAQVCAGGLRHAMRYSTSIAEAAEQASPKPSAMQNGSSAEEAQPEGPNVDMAHIPRGRIQIVPPPPWTPTRELKKRNFLPRRMGHLMQVLTPILSWGALPQRHV
jgi:hypothetical protein